MVYNCGISWKTVKQGQQFFLWRVRQYFRVGGHTVTAAAVQLYCCHSSPKQYVNEPALFLKIQIVSMASGMVLILSCNGGFNI
jgi:hypothetical protein